MTQAKYATVLTALANAGYSIREAGQRPDGQWFIVTFLQSGQTDAGTVSSFAATNAITATVETAYLV